METDDTRAIQRAECGSCRRGAYDFPLTMAFQPIVDIGRQEIFAYEALVRGPNGENAASVFEAVTETLLYGFDQACRITAIEQATALGLVGRSAALSINFMPNAVYEPKACIRKTLETAARVGFPTDRLIFEITEGEAVTDPAHLARIVTAYRAMGFRTAIDDFGAGHSNLNLLAQFRPDIIKLDMVLIRDIDRDDVRQSLVRHCVGLCDDLGILMVAEGIENLAEYQTLRGLGVKFIQGHLLAKPAWQRLPEAQFIDFTIV